MDQGYSMYLAGPSPPFFSTEHTYRSVLLYSFGFYDSVFRFSFDTLIATSGYDGLDRPRLVLVLFVAAAVPLSCPFFFFFFFFREPAPSH